MFPESNEQNRPARPRCGQERFPSRNPLRKGPGDVWEEGKTESGWEYADDIWVKFRINGKEGWIHSDEDLQANLGPLSRRLGAPSASLSLPGFSNF